MKSMTLHEAAAFLKLHPEELRRRAKRELLPAAKVGKRWVFLELDLAEYLRSLYAGHWQALRVIDGKETDLCHSSNVVIPGGSISSPQMASEYAELLGLSKKR